MTWHLRRCFAILFLAAASATPISAQERADSANPVDPSETARFRFGPLRFTPSIKLTNVGVDGNVFNDPLDPKQDTVGALGPATNLWMHFGRSRLSGKVSAEYLYFDRYKNERALNTNHQVKWEVPLARFTPFVEGSYANTKNRSGYEIDSRARLVTQSVGLGTEVRLASQMVLVLGGARSRLDYDDAETFLGAGLATALNRWTNAETLQLRYRLTSLTTFVVKGEALQDRFGLDSERNANSIAVMPGFEMKPSALVSGHVFAGIRNFTPLNATIPPYRGPVASVDATYTVRATRLAAKVSRDLAYSYQQDQPYYTLTDVTLVLTERLTYTWDVVVTAGRQLLDYAAVTGALAAVDPERATVRQYGAGIGYRVGRTLRLGIDGSHFVRRSTNRALRDYEGFRLGGSLTYGLSQ